MKTRTDPLFFFSSVPPSPSSCCAQSPGEVKMCHSSRDFQMNVLVSTHTPTSRHHLLPLTIAWRLAWPEGFKIKQEQRWSWNFFLFKTFLKPSSSSLCFFNSISISPLNRKLSLMSSWSAGIATPDCAFSWFKPKRGRTLLCLCQIVIIIIVITTTTIIILYNSIIRVWAHKGQNYYYLLSYTTAQIAVRWNEPETWNSISGNDVHASQETWAQFSQMVQL